MGKFVTAVLALGILGGFAFCDQTPPSNAAPNAGPAAAAPAFMSLRVAGVRLVLEADEEAGIRPFNEGKGLSVSLIGEMPEGVLLIKKYTLTTAVADTGENLLPETDKPLTNPPRLSKDQKLVVFDCALRAPGPNVRGLKVLSGSLTYVPAGGTKDVDLGALALRQGEQGKVLDARIDYVGKVGFRQNASSELRMVISAPFEAVRDVKFLDASGAEIAKDSTPPANRNMRSTNVKYSPTGKEIALESKGRTGRFAREDTVRITVTRPGDFPAEAKIIVQMYDTSKESTLPFKIENIDLLGRPMK